MAAKSISVSDPVTCLVGVGEKTNRVLNEMGIFDVEELLEYFPVRYIDLTRETPIGELAEGCSCMVRGTVASAAKWQGGYRKTFSFLLEDETGEISVFYFNQPYLINRFQPGDSLRLFGRVRNFRGKLFLENPSLVNQENLNIILPVYSLPKGLRQDIVRKAQKQALENAMVQEFWSDEFRSKAGLWDRKKSMYALHFPKKMEDAHEAHRSVVLDELLIYSLMLQEMEPGNQTGAVISSGPDSIDAFENLLPFTLTKAQRNAMEDIRRDLASGKNMSRLVQGDVGSGKTVIAFFGAWLAGQRGKYTFFMAPTEILAEQHYRSAQRILGDKAALLTGKTTPKERETVYEKLAAGEVSTLIGTHALLYAEDRLPRPDLVITDEQHRFGVAQRARLSQGGCHMLIMSATPIPRSLSLILYGRSSVSAVKDLPPGRKPIKTRIVTQSKRKDLYRWVLANCADHKTQAYVVCPLVEPSEQMEAASVLEVYAELSQLFPAGRTAYLHGKMKPAEKEEILMRFRRGETWILISSTVIEVGIDVPNATVMVIEDAHRFGLAQMHQLRGRVGRGQKESFCFLVSDNRNNERLRTLRETEDGFLIAEKDLEMRGAGELLGQRQHGKEMLTFADPVKDMQILEEAMGLLPVLQQFPQDLAMAKARAAKKLQRQLTELVLN